MNVQLIMSTMQLYIIVFQTSSQRTHMHTVKWSQLLALSIHSWKIVVVMLYNFFLLSPFRAGMAKSKTMNKTEFDSLFSVCSSAEATTPGALHALASHQKRHRKCSYLNSATHTRRSPLDGDEKRRRRKKLSSSLAHISAPHKTHFPTTDSQY